MFATGAKLGPNELRQSSDLAPGVDWILAPCRFMVEFSCQLVYRNGVWAFRCIFGFFEDFQRFAGGGVGFV